MMQEELANKEVPIEDEESGLAITVVVWSIVTSTSAPIDYAYM